MLAPTDQNRTFAVSRNWQAVSKSIQKLAVGMYAVKSEGMFPYGLTMSSQPTKRSSNSTNGEQRRMSSCASGREACWPAHLKSDRTAMPRKS